MTGDDLTAAVLAALLLALPGGVRAQPVERVPSEPPLFVERLDVEIVNLDVVVTDRRGHPVTGLIRDDFELRVDGEPIPIENFYAVDPERPAGAASPPEAPIGAAPAPSPAPGPAPAVSAPPRMTILVVAEDAEGRLSEVQTVDAPVRIPAARLEEALGGVAGYRVGLLLRPGPHRLAIGVRDEIGNVVATMVLEHDVAPPRSR